ncbi:hypothetical protein CBX96_00325 [Shewanella sp. BC20]|nr:hypothetical protein CBX96_00325 [Shewanella sp. BC20]
MVLGSIHADSALLMSYEGEIIHKFAKKDWLKGGELTLRRLAVASRGGGREKRDCLAVPL